MADEIERDENFTSEDEASGIESDLTGPRLWCGVFAGQMARIELTDLDVNARDRIAVRMREMVQELAVEAGATTPAMTIGDLPEDGHSMAGTDDNPATDPDDPY